MSRRMRADELFPTARPVPDYMIGRRAEVARLRPERQRLYEGR
ncbi:MAG: hypothetical protein ACYDH5_00415 [Acidimicrobiales bacterium]